MIRGLVTIMWVGTALAVAGALVRSVPVVVAGGVGVMGSMAGMLVLIAVDETRRAWRRLVTPRRNAR